MARNAELDRFSATTIAANEFQCTEYEEKTVPIETSVAHEEVIQSLPM